MLLTFCFFIAKLLIFDTIHYTTLQDCAIGCKKLEGTVKNVFTIGKMTMDVVVELGSTNGF